MGRSDLICESGIMNNNMYSSYVHEGKHFGTDYSDITADEKAEQIAGHGRHARTERMNRYQFV